LEGRDVQGVQGSGNLLSTIGVCNRQKSEEEIEKKVDMVDRQGAAFWVVFHSIKSPWGDGS
jgi:hypothetical protein